MIQQLDFFKAPAPMIEQASFIGENNGPRRWEVKLLYRVLQCNIGDIMDYVPDEPTKEEVRG
jgi:hypothetical protein